MAWGRSRFSRAEWASWQKSQDWTPKDKDKQKDVAKSDKQVKKEQAEEELERKAAIIRQQFDAQLTTPVRKTFLASSPVAPIPKAAPAAPPPPVVEDNTKHTAQLNKVLALKESLPLNDPLLPTLEDRISALRLLVRKELPIPQLLEEAVLALATAQQKLENRRSISRPR